MAACPSRKLQGCSGILLVSTRAFGVMRLALLAVLGLLLSGCSGSDPSGADATDGDGDGGRTSEDGDEPLPESAGPPTVITVDGSLDLAAHPAPGQDVNVIGDPYQLDVSDDVRQIYMELVWPEVAAGVRQGMTLRAISDTEHWYYGGSGT